MMKSFKLGFLILNIVASVVLALSFFAGVKSPTSQLFVLVSVVVGMFISGMLIGAGAKGEE